jgi:AraC-like DNA-binding protein
VGEFIFISGGLQAARLKNTARALLRRSALRQTISRNGQICRGFAGVVAVDIKRHDMPPASGWDLHAHEDEALLSYAAEGSCTKLMPERAWPVLPGHAIWVPPGMPHATMIGPAGCRLRTVSFPRPVPEDLPLACCVLQVSPFLASLIEAWDQADDPPRRRALTVLILDETHKAPRLDLGLSKLRDPRLQRVTDGLFADPADPRDVASFAALAGMSSRSFARRFRQESGLAFGEWRRQLRLFIARQLLAGGAQVTQAAYSLGYSSPSAFIAMVRRELGVTPTQWFRSNLP